MLSETEAQIYLAQHRGKYTSEGFRSCRTLDFEDYKGVDRERIGNLIAFNDETLHPEASLTFDILEKTLIILIPLVGGLEIELGNSDPAYVSAGESLGSVALPNKEYKISNPYPNNTVTYLHLRFGPADIPADEVMLTGFNLAEKNTLLPAFETIGGGAHIGMFDGRAEGIFKQKFLDRPIFTFVIEGAFEVQNRLLESRDALAVWNVGELEFEALSQDAVILIVSA